jgi:hypothetical protein
MKNEIEQTFNIQPTLQTSNWIKTLSREAYQLNGD